MPHQSSVWCRPARPSPSRTSYNSFLGRTCWKVSDMAICIWWDRRGNQYTLACRFRRFTAILAIFELTGLIFFWEVCRFSTDLVESYVRPTLFMLLICYKSSDTWLIPGCPQTKMFVTEFWYLPVSPQNNSSTDISRTVWQHRLS